MTKKRLQESVRKFSQSKQTQTVLIDGELGIPIGGAKVVEVPGRAGFVYVRIRGNQSELIQAYNAAVSPIYGLPVLLARDGNICKVIGRNLDRYRDWGNTPYLPKHGSQHSFNHELGIGADIVWVYSQQFMPLLAYPSGTAGSMNLVINPAFYEWNGSWKFSQTTGTPSFTPYLPSGSASARMTLLYIQPSDNSLRIAAGSEFADSITGSAQIAQYIPDISRDTGIPVAAVRLTSGTTAITWDAIYDVRDFFTPRGSSLPSGSSAGIQGIVIQDEGIILGTGTVLNFVGNNVDASISGSVIRVFVTGSTGGSVNPPITGSIVIQDEGVTLGSVTVLNVVGAPVDISISGSVARLFVTGSSSASSTGSGSVGIIYPRAGVPTSLSSPTGTFWRVPDLYYVTGSLAVFNQGHVLIPGTDYSEQYPGSGTYQYTVSQPTGTYHLSYYGVTGTVVSVAGGGSTGSSGGDTGGWLSDANTWSFLSADSPSYVVSVNANVTGSINVGMKTQMTHLGSTKNFFVTAISVTGSTSYLNLYGGTDYSLTTGAITSPKYSFEKSPFDFPTLPSKWTQSASNGSIQQMNGNSPTANTWYNSISLSVPIGAWIVSYDAVFQMAKNNAAQDCKCTLSTANNSESDNNNTSYNYRNGSVTGDMSTYRKEIILELTAKAAYYLNHSTTQASLTVFQTRGDVSPTKISAICAYL